MFSYYNSSPWMRGFTLKGSANNESDIKDTQPLPLVIRELVRNSMKAKRKIEQLQETKKLELEISNGWD